MHIISCDNCCVMLDALKLCFPAHLYDEHGNIDENKAAWDGEEWVAKVECPVCRADILKDKP